MNNYKQKDYQSESPEMLDKYLSEGWYRIQQRIITTDFIQQYDNSEIAFWIRYDLNRFQDGKKNRKIRKQSEIYFFFGVNSYKHIINNDCNNKYYTVRSCPHYKTKHYSKRHSFSFAVKISAENKYENKHCSFHS